MESGQVVQCSVAHHDIGLYVVSGPNGFTIMINAARRVRLIMIEKPLGPETT